MRILLPRGMPSPIGRNGRSLRLSNGPSLDYGLTAAGQNALVTAFVLIGFDRTPSAGNYDAIIPPWTELTITVPPAVRSITLLWPSDFGAQVAGPTGISGAALAIQGEWLDCEAISGYRPLTLVPSVVTQEFAQGVDGWGNIWPFDARLGVLDQAVAANYLPHMRPMIAPSAIGITHAVTAINTIFTLAGPSGGSPNYNVLLWTVLKKLWVSVSAATLVVIGNVGLTVGSPGAFEIWRGQLPAGLTSIDFGEGLEVNAGGGGPAASTPLKAYTAVAVTADVTVAWG